MLCVGYFVTLYRGSDLGSFLFMNWGVKEHVAHISEKVLGAFIIWLGLMHLLNPNKILAWLLSMLFVSLLIVTLIVGGKHFAHWAVWTGALKWASPWGLYFFANANKRDLIALIKIATSITFATHGMQALSLNPVFLDYILLNPFLISSQSSAEVILKVIGLIDILVAFLLLFNYKPAFYWVVLWGFSIALLRLIDGGIYNYPEFLLRVPYFSGILALMFIFKKQPSYRANPWSEFGKIA